MNLDTQTAKAPPFPATSATGVGRPPSGIAHDRRVQHARAQLAAARRRERAQQRGAQVGEERRALLDQLRAGRGVSDILDAVAQPQDTPAERVRRARLLRDVLQELASGAAAIRSLNQRKAMRFLAFLEPEIAWLENVASGRGTPAAPPPIAA